MAAASSGPGPPPSGPPGTGPPPGTAPPVNYAATAAASHPPKYIHLHLHREDKNISFNLSKKEKAILMFRRLKLQPSQVIGIESCNFEQIRIEVRQEVDVEKFKTTTAMQIRHGLKVKPMKELKKSTRVKVCWVPSDVHNAEIVTVLSNFGKVVSEPQDLYFELSEEEMKDSDLFGLRSIKSGERAVEIEILRNIPSYVKIGGKRARIWYPGQNFTCGRCYKSFRSCPGKADRRECARNGGEEKDFEEFWAETMARQPIKESMREGDTFGTDTIDLARVPDAVTKKELMEWLKEDPRNITVGDDTLAFSGFRGTWRITNIESDDIMKMVVERLHGAKIRGKPILCLPIKQNTPNKHKTTDMEPAAMETAEAPAMPAITSVGTETQEERNNRIRREQEETRKAVERERELMRSRATDPADEETQAADLTQQQQGVQAGPGAGGQTVEGKDGGHRRPRAAVGGETEGEATGDSTSPKVSTNGIVNTLKVGLEKFGILKRRDEINLNRDIVEETPASIPKNVHNPNEVATVEASPELKEPEKDKTQENEAAEGDITINTDDEIFTQQQKPFSPSDLQPANFSSDFARRIIVT